MSGLRGFVGGVGCARLEYLSGNQEKREKVRTSSKAKATISHHRMALSSESLAESPPVLGIL
eukprot:scaffold13709_cov54-Cylindrotheca_fusiformis.AAC.2